MNKREVGHKTNYIFDVAWPVKTINMNSTDGQMTSL